MVYEVWFISFGSLFIVGALFNISSHIKGIKKLKKHNPNKIRTKDGLILMLSNNINSYRFWKEEIKEESSEKHEENSKKIITKWAYFVKIDFVHPIEKENSKIYEITSYEFDLHTN
ncbi:MAG: hypothetical protein HRT98_02465 [Mycoplasmatales bacterium]|nr:hypothetical protein [Mycoplasmatales bacterium]